MPGKVTGQGRLSRQAVKAGCQGWRSGPGFLRNRDFARVGQITQREARPFSSWKQRLGRLF
jgi:hypothetical protein